MRSIVAVAITALSVLTASTAQAETRPSVYLGPCIEQVGETFTVNLSPDALCGGQLVCQVLDQSESNGMCQQTLDCRVVYPEQCGPGSAGL